MNGTLAIRNIYMARFIGRCIILVLCIVLCFTGHLQTEVLEGMNFFKEFTLLHILWLIWVFDMVRQLIPAKGKIALGSQKNFGKWFRAAEGRTDRRALKEHTRKTDRRAGLILVIWIALTAALGIFHHIGILTNAGILIVSTFFYVCDLICVLFWCPFRLILGNRCCTTCRIFNWDHLMMFTPMILIPGFYTWTLAGLSIIVWLFWEGSIDCHPERFWDKTNAALKCGSCTDKLCTQYCGKRRKQR